MVDLDEIKEEILYLEGYEALEYTAQRSCGYLKVFQVRLNEVLSNIVYWKVFPLAAGGLD